MIVGIDPGALGAIAFFSRAGFLVTIEDMPTVEVMVGRTKRPRVSPALVAASLRDKGVTHAYIENVGAMPGQSGMFAFGRSFGVIEGVLATLCIPTSFVTPRVWKSSFSLAKDKGLARQTAIQMLPGAAHYFARVKDDGRAEAALIGLYGSRSLLQVAA